MTEQDIKKGLAGVVVDYTAISKVNPETNSLLYRGYPVQELAATAAVRGGRLPALARRAARPRTQLAEFAARERVAARARRRVVKQVIDVLPLTAHPMDVVRTAVSVIGATRPDRRGRRRARPTSPRRCDLFAQLPAIVAYDQRRRRGQELVEPRDDLGYAANFLWMTFGEEPDPVVVDAFDVSMILYAEHSFNASTFTARVITSTLSDLYSAVVGAIGALKGPLHGGANEAVMHIFDEIGIGRRTSRPWLDDALAEKRKIMGFGHRVYKHGDSRVPTMKAALDTLVEHYDRPDLAGPLRRARDGDASSARASSRTSTTRRARRTT